MLELVVAGLPTHRIADRLCISTNTVQDHLKAIFGSVGARRRRDLVRGAADRLLSG